MQLQIPDPDIMASPEDFIRIIHHHIVNVYIEHLPEHFRSVYDSVRHFQIVRIPQRRPTTHGKIAFVYGETVYMPERIIAFKTTAGSNDVAAFLYGRLPFENSDIVYMKVMRSKQGALPAE